MVRGFLRDFADIGARMVHAHAEGRLSDIGALAHQVRGSAGYFGAEDCAASAAALEEIAAADPAQDPAVALAHFLPLAQEVLAALGHMLEAELPSSAPAVGTGSDDMPPDAGSLLDLLRRATPLVATGDLAARALLESLTAGLAGHPIRARAAEALELFEDLELSASLAALHLVETELTAAIAEGPAAEGAGGRWRDSVGTLRSDHAREAGIVPEARA